MYGLSSYCLGKAHRLDGSYLRTFAFELREQLAQTLAAFVTSILAGPRRRLETEEAAEPPLRQIIEVLQQVMCTHDAEKLAISVLEIYKDSYAFYSNRDSTISFLSSDNSTGDIYSRRSEAVIV